MMEVARHGSVAWPGGGQGGAELPGVPGHLHLHNEVKRQEQPHFPPGEARMCSVHLQQPG